MTVVCLIAVVIASPFELTARKSITQRLVNHQLSQRAREQYHTNKNTYCKLDHFLDLNLEFDRNLRYVHLFYIRCDMIKLFVHEGSYLVICFFGFNLKIFRLINVMGMWWMSILKLKIDDSSYKNCYTINIKKNSPIKNLIYKYLNKRNIRIHLYSHLMWFRFQSKKFTI